MNPYWILLVCWLVCFVVLILHKVNEEIASVVLMVTTGVMVITAVVIRDWLIFALVIVLFISSAALVTINLIQRFGKKNSL